MQRGLQTEIYRIALLALLLIVIGLLNEHLLLTLLLGGALYMALAVYNITNLYRWLNSNRLDMPPEASGIWGDISDQLYRIQQKHRRSVEAQRSTLARIQSITSSLDEGIVLLNAYYELDWWNPAAEQLLCLQQQDHGQAITNLVRKPAFVSYIHRKKFKKHLEVDAPDDDQRKLLISAASFGDDNIALVIRDITQLRNMEQMRTDFVANISHELRTPLTVLSGYIETLQDNTDNLPRTWLTALEQMAQQTRRMNTLSNDLVLLSQIEAREEKPPSESVSLQPLLEQIVKDAQALTGEKHTIALSCPEELNLTGDAKELYSAFSNLVINAIKHNPAGANIRVAAERKKKAVTVSVSDDGIGIEHKHIGRLTERFYRADTSRASNTGGTGLGLAIVKHAILRHHGTLSIQSKPGEGSTFSCRFAN